MTKQDQFNEIFEVLQAVVKHKGQPILEVEVRAMGARLVEHHGVELFRILWAIAEEKYFPTGFEIEQRARRALGKPPLKGLTEEKIERNERELVVAGQMPEKAKAGAEMLRKTLRQRELSEIVANAQPGSLVYEMIEKVNEHLLSTVANPLAGLEDFGEGTENPLADLESWV